MYLTDWIREKLNEQPITVSELYSMRDDAIIATENEYSVESYNRAVRKIFAETSTKAIKVPMTSLSTTFNNAGNVLVVSDLHAPWIKQEYLEFCKEQYNRFNCKTVVFIGDIIDNHAISYHDKNPNGMSPGDELTRAITILKEWYKAFPTAYVCFGNHDMLVRRRAVTHGLPSQLFKTFGEIIQAPKGWNFALSWIIDDVVYTHGTNSSGQYAFVDRATKNRKSTVIGHIHSVLAVRYMASHHDRIFGMCVGCVDANTEFFNGTQWKKISEWNNDKVLQYNEDGTANLVNPLNYIKVKCRTLNHFEHMYGMSQTLCDNHNMVFISRNKNKLINFKFKEFEKLHKESNSGFRRGTVPVTFNYSGNGLNISDDELRLQVAFIADGTLRISCSNKGLKKGCLTLRKHRKIERLEMLLNRTNTSYTSKTYKNDKRFVFTPPILVKTFEKLFFNCTNEQLKIIIDECIYWDGTVDKKQRKSFCTSIKENADFIQFAANATGHCATICKDRRAKNTSYKVIISNRVCLGFNSSKKIEIVKVDTIDGYKYCFSVPSKMLVLRNNDNIFVTGNCGIDISAYAFDYGQEFTNRPIIGCGIVLDYGKEAYAIPMKLERI